MNQNEIKVFFAILRSAMSDNRLNSDELTLDSLPNLLKIAEKHDVLHLLAYGIKKNELLSDGNPGIDKSIFKAVYRYEGQQYEYETLCNTLDKAGIPFISLKGSIMRRYYPEAWMRTSCDIDILVHEEDVDNAKSILMEQCDYQYHEKGSHDVSLFTPGGVHVELHYDLVEDDKANDASVVLKEVWNSALVGKNFLYRYEMPDEMFYFYHIAHMAKHFEGGGCGIRTFIDLWILDNIEGADRAKRDELLARGKLLKFAQVARRLSKAWFEGAEMDEITEQMQNYILFGGVYGNSKNRIVVQQQKKGGRIRYALSKIVIPYDVIKFHYPILQKHRWLTPFMQVRRWCKLIFCGHAKRAINELKYNQSVSAEKADQTKRFLSDIGLE